MTGMMKHRSPRKFSQAALRNVTQQKLMPRVEDLFDIIETPEEKAMRKRLHEKALKEAKLHSEILNHKFTIGKKYVVRDFAKAAKDSALTDKDEPFIYLGKQGKHHIFRHVAGGWTRTFTDPQLIGKFIQEV